MIGERPNFGDLFWRAGALYPAKTAIEQGELVLSYAELEERTQRTAALLAGRGVRRGERVLLLFPNDFRFAECLFGTLRAGAVAVPANVKLGGEALAYIAEHSEAVVLIAHADLADKVDAIRARVPGLQVLAVAGEIAGADSYDAAVAESRTGAETALVDPGDEALLMYTSGSTGAPKGVMLSHSNKWWQARSAAETMLWKHTDKALVTGPLYHANALWACMLPMFYVGGSIVILPGFDPPRVLEAGDRYQPT